MKRTTIILLLIVATLFTRAGQVCAAENKSGKPNDEVTLTQLYREFKVFEARTDERFVSIEKRFEQVDKRLDSMDKRISDVQTFLIVISGIFSTLTVAMLGIIFWDRRTIIEKSVEKSLAKTKEFAADRDTNDRLMAALRELAQTDAKLADTLKRFNLL
jgi:nitrate reductase NapE component